MDISLDNDAISKRLMEVCGVDSLGAVAKLILNNSSRSGSWRRGNKIPAEIFVKAAIKFDSSVDYIVFGRPPAADNASLEKAFHKSLMMLVGSGCLRKGESYNKETIDEVIKYFSSSILGDHARTDFEDMEKLIELVK